MITSFNHTGVVVKDIDAMIAFYTDLLGLTVTARYEMHAGPEGDHAAIPGSKRVEVFLGLDEESHQLELIQYLEPVPEEGHVALHRLGSTHICFFVDNLAEIHKELSAKGIRFVTNPIFDKTPEGDDWGVVYFQDPEDNWLEFIQV